MVLSKTSPSKPIASQRQLGCYLTILCKYTIKNQKNKIEECVFSEFASIYRCKSTKAKRSLISDITTHK